MKNELDGLGRDIYRGSDTIRLQELVGTIVEEAKLSYRNREALSHVLYIAPICFYMKSASFHPFNALATMAIMLLYSRYKLVRSMKSIEAFKRVQKRIGSTKNEKVVDDKLEVVVDSKLEADLHKLCEGDRSAESVLFHELTAIGLLVGTVAHGLGGDAFIGQASVSAVAGILAAIIGSYRNKVTIDFRDKMVAILPYVGPEVAAPNVDLAIVSASGKSPTGVRIAPLVTTAPQVADRPQVALVAGKKAAA